MLCVTTVSYSIGFNGTSVGPIIPKCGLRQGDHLTPYLFLLCVEGLFKSITIAAANRILSGCKLSPSAPAVTHLHFADDIFLFFKATREQSVVVKKLLNTYK